MPNAKLDFLIKYVFYMCQNNSNDGNGIFLKIAIRLLPLVEGFHRKTVRVRKAYYFHVFFLRLRVFWACAGVPENRINTSTGT
jgi:hypothetical protein